LEEFFEVGKPLFRLRDNHQAIGFFVESM
jgi:hypothetical protein